jgi:hypothetical protein
MCGASSQQQQLEQEQADFYQSAMQESQTAFGEQQDLLKQMEAVYNPILAKGPNQMGYSPEELATLNAQAVEGTAQNYQQAARAVGEQTAAEGGGSISMPTGAQTQLKQQVAQAAAQQESGEESQIQEAGYSQGYNEFVQATGALATASGDLNPAGYGEMANQAGAAASSTANQIAQENNSWMNAALGAAGNIGSAVVNQNPGGIFGQGTGA